MLILSLSSYYKSKLSVSLHIYMSGTFSRIHHLSGLSGNYGVIV